MYDQTFTGANLALCNNCNSKTPVRVIRGYMHKPGGAKEAEGTAVEGQGEAGPSTSAAAAPAAAAASAGKGGKSGKSGNGGGGGKKKGGQQQEEEEGGGKGFVYEGLYRVVEYKQEVRVSYTWCWGVR